MVGLMAQMMVETMVVLRAAWRADEMVGQMVDNSAVWRVAP